ncbi:hypothetical protein PM082_018510 [Marasmius tenuissimus]|nr:hypothetical protein PM082_018510 [Marasmius tenuissimus]
MDRIFQGQFYTLDYIRVLGSSSAAPGNTTGDSSENTLEKNTSIPANSHPTRKVNTGATAGGSTAATATLLLAVFALLFYRSPRRKYSVNLILLIVQLSPVPSGLDRSSSRSTLGAEATSVSLPLESPPPTPIKLACSLDMIAFNNSVLIAGGHSTPASTASSNSNNTTLPSYTSRVETLLQIRDSTPPPEYF